MSRRFSPAVSTGRKAATGKKIGVATRGAAALYTIECGLVEARSGGL